MKIKKYIFLLILISLLTFTLVGNCAWLSGYDHRIKLTIDNSKIDSALSDFPVTVFFTSTQAEEIFTEFDADSDYMKCAFTSSDGTTQLYAEKELFDDSESKAIYHVKVTSVSSSADTDIYYYYDNDASDNTTYIGAINTTAGENVWDSNFKAVYHMVDATTSTVVDSTSNSNDGTKTSANNPIEATGKVGQAQDFDGSNDYIDCGADNVGNNASVTFEAVFRYDVDNDSADYILSTGGQTSSVGYALACNGTNNAYYLARNTETWNVPSGWTGSLTAGTWYHLAGVFDSGNNSLKWYLNGDYVGTAAGSSGSYTNAHPDIHIGKPNNTTIYYMDGIIDEVRTAETVRSAAWLKATYNSLWDSLLTYGSEETKPVEAKGNSIMFGMNF